VGSIELGQSSGHAEDNYSMMVEQYRFQPYVRLHNSELENRVSIAMVVNKLNSHRDVVAGIAHLNFLPEDERYR
jgi:hypothetical protein